MGKTLISPNLKVTRERIDLQGNVINPLTKQIIEKNEVYVPPVIPPQPAPQATEQPTRSEHNLNDALSVQAQIDATKANLAKLEELKRLKIKEMKDTIKLLEK